MDYDWLLAYILSPPSCILSDPDSKLYLLPVRVAVQLDDEMLRQKMMVLYICK